MYIFILFGVGILILFLKYFITHWKTIKDHIGDFFKKNVGSFLYFMFLIIFIIFILFPFLNLNGNPTNKITSKNLLVFSDKYRQAMFILLFIICIIFGVWTFLTAKMPNMKLIYVIEGIIIFAAIALNVLNKFDSFPFIPFVGKINSGPLLYFFWIFFVGILIYFTSYLIRYKEKNTNNVSISNAIPSTIKYFGIFIILLFITKLFFINQEKTVLGDAEETKNLYDKLLFNGGDTTLSVSIISYILIIINIIYFIFNWGFIKWIQIFILGVIVVFVTCIILFKILFNFTSQPEVKDKEGFGSFNTNYIFLTILFFFTFILLFKFDPSNILQSSLNYIYIIGFVFGIIILVSLSIIFNDYNTTEEIFNGEYSEYIKKGSIIFIAFIFFYFFIFYIKKTVTTAEKNLNESVLLATSTAFNIGLMMLILVGLYYLSNFLHKSSYMNILFLVCIIVLFYTLFTSITKIFNSHKSVSDCRQNINLWKWQEYTSIIFAIFGVLGLGSVKKETNVNYTELLLFIAFIILGYHIGGILYNVKNKDIKTKCGEFLNKNVGISFLELIKSVIIFSIIVMSLFSMNVFIGELNKNISQHKDDSNFIFFLGLFFVVLFIVYFLFSNTSFLYIFELLKNIFNKNYFFSPNTHKFTDFLFLFAMIFIFFSSMGLIERVAMSSIIQTPFDYIKSIFKTDDSAYKSIILKVYYFIILVFNIIMFIPCIFNDMYTYAYDSVKNDKNNPVIYILIVEFCLICVYIFYRNVTLMIVKRHSTFLLSSPMWLDAPTNIETTHVINYNFGISFWIYIEPGMTNNDFLNILNYNDSPTVLYKPSMNSIIVTSQLNPENTDVEYRKKGVDTENTLVNENIKSFTTLNNNKYEGYEKRKIVSTYETTLQTWHNFFINYNSGVIDVFVDGSLISSSSGNMFDANNYKNYITVGADDLQVKMCNVCFYDKNLNMDEIIHVYNSCKNMDPPIKH